ncbi:hypothetical protein GCM10011609_28070 [Lentzea pudingi]|uniref:Uncharacterized protein n=1 Tax=Lentzea pudingi TaxID=1789439 RepID=A0ABQ2HRK3_9PSEU|nr:hypothetical protein [Lentzea pudingi]GGM89558.1 hypothetical protein GCM10011609_28070 [Lentzea pudingi]
MTFPYIRPIVPETTQEDARNASARLVGQPLPLITVPAFRAPRLTNVLYGMASVDSRGRVADRQVIAALDWSADTRLSIREHDGLLVVITRRYASSSWPALG